MKEIITNAVATISPEVVAFFFAVWAIALAVWIVFVSPFRFGGCREGVIDLLAGAVEIVLCPVIFALLFTYWVWMTMGILAAMILL